jgi:hypothetical protein
MRIPRTVEVRLVAVTMAIRANPATVVGTWSDNNARNGRDNNAGNGRDDDAGAHGMTISIGSASKSRPTAHRD